MNARATNNCALGMVAWRQVYKERSIGCTGRNKVIPNFLANKKSLGDETYIPINNCSSATQFTTIWNARILEHTDAFGCAVGCEFVYFMKQVRFIVQCAAIMNDRIRSQSKWDCKSLIDREHTERYQLTMLLRFLFKHWILLLLIDFSLDGGLAVRHWFLKFESFADSPKSSCFQRS